MRRRASDSVASRRRCAANAFPYGLPSPGGSDSVQTSSTAFSDAVDLHVEPHVEEVLVDHRVQPGRDEHAVGGRSPGATAPVESTPVSLISWAIVPSWCRYQKKP